jgi:very-short-patch-repair endonuclease
MLSNSLLAILLVIAALLIVGAALFALLKWAQRKVVSSPLFNPRPLLTPNELEFLGRLEAAAPELRFHAQVALGSLVEPRAERGSRAWLAMRNAVSQKVVDFVAQRRNDGSIVAIIELDDRTHEAWKDLKRDEMMASAGYRTVRWQSRKKPDREAIRSALLVRTGGMPLPPAPPIELHSHTRVKEFDQAEAEEAKALAPLGKPKRR